MTTEITPEMIEAYQRQQAEAEANNRRLLIERLIEQANKAGYDIVAAPQIANDGRLTAVWGVQQKG